MGTKARRDVGTGARRDSRTSGLCSSLFSRERFVEKWQIDKAVGRCAKTGALIDEGEVYYAVLYEQGESFRREEYSVAAWEGLPQGAYCCFKTRMPVKEKKKRLLVDDDVLVNFFRRLKDETRLVRLQFRFVLALILMR
ncbi:MAG: hypothetical protein V3W34_11540, partial [Phycisphaerae bacterium]